MLAHDLGFDKCRLKWSMFHQLNLKRKEKMKVAVFEIKSQYTALDPKRTDISDDINKLLDTGVRVIEIKQTSAGTYDHSSGVVTHISIWYEDKPKAINEP